ncbi:MULTISPECIES: FKBP-type peptidyl-prolyl cis-trans isomerase [Chitinophagaceae]|uniref:FKBP-type peptidyl-prolyl cis-trans isomerase n=1 Tax=Chitinophagaceae TaxID=563835 RepID=UPI000DEFF9EC|nr:MULTISPECIES: FKBP-type peptidyl-prolyl cis-trans isomerase [Chitinophagaceae]RPD51512.1 FKBP-type peptidylprolyl isomerase [Paracnuella aquatica]
MKKTLLTLAIAATLAGCLKNEEPQRNCNYDECALKAPAAEIQAVKEYLTTNNITNYVEHCSGLMYVIDSVGTGATPGVCSGVSIRYKGMLTNGTVFDKSETSTPYWELSNLIRGWVNGLPKIKQGGGMKLYIPPTLGYGAAPQTDRNGNVIIPANSITVFEVKLDGVVN